MSAAKSSSQFDTTMKWNKMNIAGKLVFMGKLVVFLCTFGFAYPNLLLDE